MHIETDQDPINQSTVTPNDTVADIPEDLPRADNRTTFYLKLDPNDPNPQASIETLMALRIAANQGIGPEMDIVTGFMKSDLDYAWTWVCSIACCAMDQGVDHATANRIGINFIQLLCGVDMSQYTHYLETQVKD